MGIEPPNPDFKDVAEIPRIQLCFKRNDPSLIVSFKITLCSKLDSGLLTVKLGVKISFYWKTMANVTLKNGVT